MMCVCVLHALFVNIHTEIIYLKGRGNDNKYLFDALKLNFCRVVLSVQ